MLLKLTFDNNSNFFLNANNIKKEENDKSTNINWGEMSWLIVKLLKNSHGETVNFIN